MTYRLGVDTGGTFTDFIVVDESEHTYLTHKTPSTPEDPSESFVQGLTEIAGLLELDVPRLVRDISLIVHGTTVATNAVLTGAGARCALLTTEGFRDALQMRRGMREETLNNKLPPPPPLVPRHLRFPIPERVTFEGEESRPLSIEAVREATKCCEGVGAEAIAVCFLHSYANPEHEKEAKAILAERLPGAYITASHELLAQIRFYERVSTTVLNAATGPLIESYLDRLVGRLQELDFRGELLIMQSSGGVTKAAIARERAAATLLSGPAGVPVAGARYATDVGEVNCLTIDMGGTSFDAALIPNGRPKMLHKGGWINRYRTALPMLAINTIGAGGGSIAWIDASGILRIGPKSAGADPGPACYQRGGSSPTCTDANLILGYLNAQNFLGGRIRLDVHSAEQAIRREVAEPLGMNVREAAAAMFEVINVNMTEGIREVSVDQGEDPRDFLLVVAGGAGPVHAAVIAAELGIPRILVPRDSSVFAAAGMLLAEVRHDALRGLPTRLADLDMGALNLVIDELHTQVERRMRAEGFSQREVDFETTLHLRYEGQFHEIPLSVPSEEFEGPIDWLSQRFDEEHERLYGWKSPGNEIELINVGLSGTAARPKPARANLGASAGTADEARVATREIYSSGDQKFDETPIFDGIRLPAGAALRGPVVIELPTTTVVVPAGWRAEVTELGDFALTS